MSSLWETTQHQNRTSGQESSMPRLLGKIRIPLEDAETSLPVEAKPTRTSAADEALEPAHQEATTSQKLLGSTTATQIQLSSPRVKKVLRLKRLRRSVRKS